MFKPYHIFFLIVIFGCTQTNTRIIEFEKVLGVEQVDALDKLVADFENNLKKHYPDVTIEKGYKQYLNDLISGATTNRDKFIFQTEETNKIFHESGFWDAVYVKDIEDNIQINRSGMYIQALYAISSSDSLTKVYREKRKAAGLMQNELFVNGILNANPDFNDYIHKRIVVVEFSF